MSRRPFLSSVASLFLGALLVAGCGGGSSGGGGGGPTTGATDLLITDAAVDELLSFSTTIQGIRMVSNGGAAGANLLAAPVSIELIGAGAAPRWILRQELPEGSFRGVALALAAGSSSAIDRAGAPVAIAEVNTSFELRFASPVAIDSSSYRQVVLDVDLAASLSGTVAAPPLFFDPTGTAALVAGGSSTSAIDEVKGIVRSVDAAGKTFAIDAFADGDLALPLGRVAVDVTGATLLLDDDGLPFATLSSFFGALSPSITLVEVHGDLVGGRVVATRIEIEDDGIGSPSYVVKLDGRIANLDTAADAFDLEIIEIEKGAALALPAIGGNSSIAVSYSAATVIVLDEHIPTTEASLGNGQRVKVKFPTFVGAPFPASQIEIEGQPEFEGRITSVAGLPATITIRLDSDEPAIASGQVQSSSTDVLVDLSASTLFLDTDSKPALASTQLQPGLKLEVHGAITGRASAPTIAAAKTKIHAGRFRGEVLADFPALHAFDAAMTDLDDPFGQSVVFGNVAVSFAPGCVFDGDVASEGGFHALFAGLGQGERLEVEVFGIGTIALPNEILCYEVKAKVD